jgi:hypothetical protein
MHVHIQTYMHVQHICMHALMINYIYTDNTVMVYGHIYIIYIIYFNLHANTKRALHASDSCMYARNQSTTHLSCYYIERLK